VQVVAGRLEWCVPFDRVPFGSGGVCPLRYLPEWLQGELSGVSLSIVSSAAGGVSPSVVRVGCREN
jgi:hypothetical protein